MYIFLYIGDLFEVFHKAKSVMPKKLCPSLYFNNLKNKKSLKQIHTNRKVININNTRDLQIFYSADLVLCTRVPALEVHGLP